MSNIYAILDDSDNEEGPVVVKPKKEDKKKAAAPAAAPAPAPAPAAAKENNKSAPAEKGTQKSKENKKKDNNTETTPAPAKVAAEVEVAKDDNRGGRGRGGDRKGRGEGRGEGRGGRGRRDGEGRGGREGRGEKREVDPDRPPRKREFDRRSGTGRSGEQSKGGRGAYAFGNEESEARQAEKDPSSAVPETEVAVEEEGAYGWGAEAAAAPEVVPEQVVPEAEPVPPTFTLDEFLAKRNEARSKAELFGEVKTRAVQDDIAGKLLKADDTEELFASVSAKAKKLAEAKKQRSTAKSQVDVNFKTPPKDEGEYRPRDREGGRGGGRGEGRGGRGGRGDRDRSPRTPAGARIDISDAASFPAL